MLVGVILANFLFVAMGILIVSLVRQDRRVPGAAAPRHHGPHPADGSRHRTTFLLEPISVEFEAHSFLLDGILTDDNDEFGYAGWPVTLRLPRSGTHAVDAWMHALLGQWTAGEAALKCTLDGDERHPRASITDGSSTLHFSENADRHAA